MIGIFDGLDGLIGFNGRLRIVSRRPIKPIRPIPPIRPIKPIKPIPPIRNRPVGSVSLLPVLAGPIHLLLDATLLLEVLLYPLYEAADEHVALVDERDGNIGDGFVSTVFNFLTVDG